MSRICHLCPRFHRHRPRVFRQWPDLIERHYRPRFRRHRDRICSLEIAAPEPENHSTSIALWLANTAAAVAFSLFALRAFLWLIYQKGEQIAVLSRNNLGDLPLHIQYIRFFSHGAPLWPANPIHAHSTIGYPFGVDYFNALLDVRRLSALERPQLLTGLLGSAATGIALFRWARSFGLAGFLFSGGAAGLAIFQTGEWIDYQRTMDSEIAATSVVRHATRLPLRAPAGLLLLTHWRRAESNETAPHPSVTGAIESNSSEKKRLLPTWLEVAIYGTMPLFHLHTFLFLSVILGALALLGKNAARFRWIGLAAFFPATFLVWLVTDGFQAGSHIAWHPGWMQGEIFFPGILAAELRCAPISYRLAGDCVISEKRTRAVAFRRPGIVRF